MITRCFLIGLASSVATFPAYADPIVILGGPGGGLFDGTQQVLTATTAINIGSASTVTGDLAVGLGNAVSATGAASIGLGNGALASGAASIGLGNGVNASGAAAVGLGDSALASGTASIAVGRTATASGNNGIAIGVGARAGQTASIAIGAGAVTSRANQIAIGTGSSTYTLVGINSNASVSVLNGPTNIVVTDSNGNLGTSTIDTSRLAGLDSRVGNLDGRVGNIETATAALANDVATLKKDVRRGYEGTALALALGGASLPENRRFAVSGNFGMFRGETAVGASAAFRATENVSFNGGIGAGLARGGVGGRGGVMLAW